MSEVQLMRFGRLLQGAVVLCWALARLPVARSPLGLLLVAESVVCGACLFYGLFVAQAALSFWTIETLEIMNTLTYGGVETGQYPMSIYRPWFRGFFTFVVPLACTTFIPLSTAMRAGSFAAPLWAALAPLVGVLFLALSLKAWYVGVRHYASTGS